jgi:hypothetical protein
MTQWHSDANIPMPQTLGPAEREEYEERIAILMCEGKSEHQASHDAYFLVAHRLGMPVPKEVSERYGLTSGSA